MVEMTSAKEQSASKLALSPLSMANKNTTIGSFLPTKYTSRPDAAYVWSSLFAGIGSGALSSIVCAPLDVLRTRMQVWGDVHNTQRTSIVSYLTDVWRTEGVKGYFRGLRATLAIVPVFWGLYFPVYEDLKDRLHDDETHPALIHMGSAILAGAFADVLCNPMFVVRTRLMTEAMHANGAESGIVETIRILHKEGGIPIFWRGLAASLAGLSHVAVQFPAYEWLKEKARQRNQSKNLTPLDLLIASGLSKMTASLLTYPHEVVRSRMMDARSDAQAALWSTVRRIWQHEGVSGFYSGLHISLLRVVPNCCVTFMTYELLLQFAKQKIHDSRRDA